MREGLRGLPLERIIGVEGVRGRDDAFEVAVDADLVGDGGVGEGNGEPREGKGRDEVWSASAGGSSMRGGAFEGRFLVSTVRPSAFMDCCCCGGGECLLLLPYGGGGGCWFSSLESESSFSKWNSVFLSPVVVAGMAAWDD